MFGFGEILVLTAVAVLFLGRKKIPQIGSSLRSSILGFKKGISGEEEKRPMRDVDPYDSQRDGKEPKD